MRATRPRGRSGSGGGSCTPGTCRRPPASSRSSRRAPPTPSRRRTRLWTPRRRTGVSRRGPRRRLAPSQRTGPTRCACDARAPHRVPGSQIAVFVCKQDAVNAVSCTEWTLSRLPVRLTRVAAPGRSSGLSRRRTASIGGSRRHEAVAASGTPTTCRQASRAACVRSR